ncbi:MAG: GGDEF domain-containing protein [Chitinophagaceae bacterium]|nr:GGDEF domain-containing protein [Rubrivivax sp.]
MTLARPPSKPTATLLCVGLVVPGATCCDNLEDAAAALRDVRFEVMVAASSAEALLQWPALTHAVLDTAVVALLAQAPAEPVTAALLERGIQDIVVQPDTPAEALQRRMDIAVRRKALDRAARKAHAFDLATGLPNHSQLLEHMTHLLALREREPAPMAAIALRIEGLARVQASLGVESANVLRRKVAVRLRASLRASDVVASIGSDAFAVLLAWIDSPQDGERVAAKLAHALARPFSVAGREQGLAVSVGLASYPEHGKDADTLMRRALAQATQRVSIGGGQSASAADRGPNAAANDA